MNFKNCLENYATTFTKADVVGEKGIFMDRSEALIQQALNVRFAN